MQMITQLHLCSFWVLWAAWLCKGRNVQKGCSNEDSSNEAASSFSPSFVMAWVFFLVEPFPWQASWGDFCQSWMIIGVLDSYSPGHSPEPALLFMFDLPFKFWEEVGCIEDQRFLHLLLSLPNDSHSASSLARQQINSSADHRLRISPIFVKKAVQMDSWFHRREFLFVEINTHK